MFASAAAPLLDVLAWPSRGLSRSRTRYRLMTVDSLAFAVQGIFIMSTKRAFGRARPYDVPCRENENYEGPCDSSSRFESFISGHTAVAFTGASLVCAHQRLRGRTLAGHIECASALAMASFAGALRIVSERHYFTDIIGGAAVGFLSGYLLPLLLYPQPDPPINESQAMAW